MTSNNPKGELNELCMETWHAPPVYNVSPSEILTPNHIPLWDCEVVLPDGTNHRAEKIGGTKKRATECAAQIALNYLHIPQKTETVQSAALALPIELQQEVLQAAKPRGRTSKVDDNREKKNTEKKTTVILFPTSYTPHGVKAGVKGDRGRVTFSGDIFKSMRIGDTVAVTWGPKEEK